MQESNTTKLTIVEKTEVEWQADTTTILPAKAIGRATPKGNIKFGDGIHVWNELEDFASGLPVISGSGSPTATTEGKVGQLYLDTTLGKERFYICNKVNSSVYTWAKIPDVVDLAALKVEMKALIDEITASDVDAEPTIEVGTTAQYFRGDKEWADLNADAVGLSNVSDDLDALRIDIYEIKSEKAQPNGVATLNSDGLLSVMQRPPAATTIPAIIPAAGDAWDGNTVTITGLEGVTPGVPSAK